MSQEGITTVAAGERARRAAAARMERPFVAGPIAGTASGVATRRVGEVVILELSGRPVLRHAAKAGGAPRAQRLMVLALLCGEASYRAWDGRMRPVRPGEVLVLESELPLDVRGEDGSVLAGVTAPLHMVSPRFLARERLRGGALRPHAGAVAGLLHQLLAGLTVPGRATPGAGALMDAVGGLVSAMLEDCWAQEADEGLAQRKTRLEQIGQHLRRNFADPALSPGAVADALGFSRRYLHKVYAQEGRSFRQDLIALRIEACLKAFADDKQAGKTIAEIAFAAGYTDISQFNRHFRRLKGATPSAVRQGLKGAARTRKGMRLRLLPPPRPRGAGALRQSG